ncbi:hypothetical protein MTO96_048971 [Rhipicephalus appendiculatus]
MCLARKPTVIKQDENRLILQEDRLLDGYNVSAKELRCSYREVVRNTSCLVPDTSPALSPPRRLVFGRPLHEEYVQVTCEVRKSKLFVEYFLVPQGRERAASRSSSRTIEAQLNILILGIDSTSSLNFRRRMTQTRRYLMEEMGAFEFLALNKVGDSSFPNQISLLSGFAASEVEEMLKRSYSNNVPLLWNVYQAMGHTTLFMEEMPHYGLFTYPNQTGFKVTPTDYYPVSVLRLMDEKGGVERFCMGSRLKTKVLIKYLGDVLKLNDHSRTFSYVWLSDVTHNHVKGIAILDEPLFDFFKGLSNRGVLDSTVVLLLSDHGARYGSTRRSELGRYEDKTPFCFLALPKRFLREHPEVAARLETNQRRLITAYDLHATLLSLSTLPSFSPNRTRHGLNLFANIPADRTCADASIPAQFCACLGAHSEMRDNSAALEFARYAIAYMNALAEFHFPGKCLVWRLDRVQKSFVITNYHSSEQSTQQIALHVLLRTVPLAHFEVYGSLPNASKSSESYTSPPRVDFVQRLDRYSEWTWCLPKSAWQKICMCRTAKYVPEHKSYSDVTLGPRNFSDRSSEAEDDDWEEHHEWTYAELDDDDGVDERGEREIANSGYHHYAGGLMGRYRGGTWYTDPKYNRNRALYYTGTAEGMKPSRNEGTRLAFNKEKSREVLAPNKQTDSKHFEQRKSFSYATNKSTKASTSKALSSTVNSTSPKFVRARDGHLRRPALHGLQKKKNKKGDALLLGSNTNRTIQSSNDNSRNAENRLNTVAEKTIGTRSPATNSLLGMKEVKSKTSTQRAVLDTSVTSSISGARTPKYVLDNSNGSKSTNVVLGHGSASRLPNEGTSAGHTDLRTKGHRHYLAYNESVWSGVGYPLVDNAFEYPRYRYLAGSRARRKKDAPSCESAEFGAGEENGKGGIKTLR